LDNCEELSSCSVELELSILYLAISNLINICTYILKTSI
jgi:hypothetical protein